MDSVVLMVGARILGNRDYAKILAMTVQSLYQRGNGVGGKAERRVECFANC